MENIKIHEIIKILSLLLSTVYITHAFIAIMNKIKWYAINLYTNKTKNPLSFQR